MMIAVSVLEPHVPVLSCDVQNTGWIWQGHAMNTIVHWFYTHNKYWVHHIMNWIGYNAYFDAFKYHKFPFTILTNFYCWEIFRLAYPLLCIGINLKAYYLTFFSPYSWDESMSTIVFHLLIFHSLWLRKLGQMVIWSLSNHF